MKVEFTPKFKAWFRKQGWQPYPHQMQMVEAFEQKKSALLIAPTGAGKTLSGFLASLLDLDRNPQKELHTIYISPLKALANDIERNLIKPIEEIGLNITVQSRTGDTENKKRVAMRKKPPNILITTPESLMLMLSYPDAKDIFSGLKLVIVDEIHAFATNKRGDLASLGMARLQYLNPNIKRFGLSATVDRPQDYADWLGGTKDDVKIVKAIDGILPEIKILKAEKAMPWAGYVSDYAVPEIYELIKTKKKSIVFVNTRAQSEIMFQQLWQVNTENLPIALHHGSLSKSERLKIEGAMSEGLLKCIIATSALDLGLDWGEVELVIQVGAPKGVSRLVQRIGRSNHRIDIASEAVLVPSNRFEAIECQTAVNAIHDKELDGESFTDGALDVAIQYITNCAISEPFFGQDIYEQMITAWPYRKVSETTFNRMLGFTENGGYALKGYDRFKRLESDEMGRYYVASREVMRNHRMNIGTIVEAQKHKIKKVTRGGHRGPIIGEVEESFAMSLSVGDTFVFAGQLLKFVGMDQLIIEAKPTTSGEPKIPTFQGGNLPLSTYLASHMREILGDSKLWENMPADAVELLELQSHFSTLPKKDEMLVETFRRQKLWHMVAYPFAGRRAHQALGIILMRYMEKLKLAPVSFTANDYSIAIVSIHEVTNPAELFHSEIIPDNYENWLDSSHLLKRSFRKVAVVSGLVGRRFPGAEKSGKQVTFSTDLIYDVLQKYQPDHILLEINRLEADRQILDMERIKDMLEREKKIVHKRLRKSSPLSIPVLMEYGRDAYKGVAMELLLENMSKTEQAEKLISEVKDELHSEQYG